MSAPRVIHDERSTLLRAEPNVGAAPSAEAGEPVWDVWVHHVTWSCEFRFHGEPTAGKRRFSAKTSSRDRRASFGPGGEGGG